MNFHENMIGGFDATMILLWVVGSLAAIFLFIVMFDSLRRNRRSANRNFRGKTPTVPGPGFMERCKLFSEAMAVESSKRRRRNGDRPRR